MQLTLGTLLMLTGFVVTASALPLTYRVDRFLPDWALSRGQVNQLASATFLTACIGLLMTTTGLMTTVTAALP
jgi:hypothetical protein